MKTEFVRTTERRWLFLRYDCLYFDNYKLSYGWHGLFSMGVGTCYILYKKSKNIFGFDYWKSVAFTYGSTQKGASTETIIEYLIWYEKSKNTSEHEPFNDLT